MQTLTQMVVEVADRDRGVVDATQIGKPDRHLARNTRTSVDRVAGMVVHASDVVLESVHQR